MRLPTARQIAKAWNSPTHEYGSRRNKAHDIRQWEVYASTIGEPISDESVKVVGRFDTQIEADDCAQRLDQDARAKNVLRLLNPSVA